MSLVPILALAFLVAKSFGLYETFREQIITNFSEQKEAFTELFKFADALLAQTRGGIVAGFGVVILVLTVVFLLSSLEGILNHIWGVKKLRTWWRIVTDYMALMIFAPIFFVIASTLSVFLAERLVILVRLFPISAIAIHWLVFFVNLLPYCLFWILFTFIYIFMPNTKVKFSSGLVAGVFVGTLYVIVQLGYIYFQTNLSSYGAIYGSMAAIPLFLLWLQISWSLFLFGAELSYAHQTLEEHEYAKRIGQISDRLKELTSLWITYLAIEKGFLTLDILSKEYKIPKGLSKPILIELVEDQILERSKKGYLPSAKVSEMRISDCLDAFKAKGVNRLPFIDSKSFSFFNNILDEFEKGIRTHPKNIRLKDVSDSI